MKAETGAPTSGGLLQGRASETLHRGVSTNSSSRCSAPASHPGSAKGGRRGCNWAGENAATPTRRSLHTSFSTSASSVVKQWRLTWQARSAALWLQSVRFLVDAQVLENLTAASHKHTARIHARDLIRINAGLGRHVRCAAVFTCFPVCSLTFPLAWSGKRSVFLRNVRDGFLWGRPALSFLYSGLASHSGHRWDASKVPALLCFFCRPTKTQQGG